MHKSAVNQRATPLKMLAWIKKKNKPQGVEMWWVAQFGTGSGCWFSILLHRTHKRPNCLVCTQRRTLAETSAAVKAARHRINLHFSGLHFAALGSRDCDINFALFSHPDVLIQRLVQKEGELSGLGWRALSSVMQRLDCVCPYECRTCLRLSLSPFLASMSHQTETPALSVIQGQSQEQNESHH